MTLFIEQFGHWLLDYYLAASLLIIGALSVMFVVRQPVRRSAVARATQVGSRLYNPEFVAHNGNSGHSYGAVIALSRSPTNC
jgi:hypothetical protein